MSHWEIWLEWCRLAFEREQHIDNEAISGSIEDAMNSLWWNTHDEKLREAMDEIGILLNKYEDILT